MLRDLVDRFAYRYRLWDREARGDKVGAGETPPEISPKSEPVWRMILRLLGVYTVGLILLRAAYRVAMRTFPSPDDGLQIIFIFLAVVWCGVGLFMIGGELLTKYSNNGNDDKSI